MVYANTILLATLGLVITSSRAAHLTMLRIALAALGLSLCVTWVLLTRRSFGFYRYWISSARELESHLSPVQTVSRGRRFADGESITIGLDKALRLGGLTKPRIETVSYLVVGVFAVVYVLTMFQG